MIVWEQLTVLSTQTQELHHTVPAFASFGIAANAAIQKTLK
ncbi:MAG: hypothetical protein ACOZBL_04840 [Patescibacteria group bacterium]